MSKNSKIHLWRCDLILHDYLFFATITRGHLRQTGPFIHNYSLTYALNWARSEWHSARQEPLYAQQLGEVKGIYVTPANLLSGSSVSTPYRTERDSYALQTFRNPNVMDHGIIECFRPGSVFRFYALARFHLDEFPTFIRLGKLLAKAKIERQSPAELKIDKGDYAAPSLLNWNDLVTKPNLCDMVVCELSSRLIENAQFVGASYLSAKFADGEELRLPLDMGYYQRELCSDWQDFAAQSS